MTLHFVNNHFLQIYGGTDICDEANEMLEQSKSFLLRLGHILVRILSTPKEEQNPFENESLSRYLSYSAWGILCKWLILKSRFLHKL